MRSAGRARGSVPAHHLLGGPLRAAIAVASRAGIGRSQGDGQVGPGHAEAVISAGVDHHVRPRRHVAGDAAPGLRARLVMVVLRAVEPGGEVALRAHGIARGAQPEPVRLVAVGARHAGLEHAALEERPVLVDLAQDLAVGVVEARVEQRPACGCRGRAGRTGRGPRWGAAARGSARRRPPRPPDGAGRSTRRCRAAGPSPPSCPSPRSSRTDRPVVPATTRGAPAGRASAQATWADPGPWHASHETLISRQAVAYWFFPPS